MNKKPDLLQKTFMRFLLPLIIQYLAFSLSEFTDSILVSQMLGDKAMAAVNMSSSFVLIFSTIALTIGTGGSAEYTRHLGEKNPKMANIVKDYSTWLFIVSGIILSLLCLTLFPMLVPAITKDPEISQAFRGYVIYLAAAALPYVLVNGMCSFLTASDHPKFAAILVIIANVLNLGMDVFYVKVVGFGAEGTALATATGYFVAMVVMYFFMKKNDLWGVMRPTKNERSSIKQQTVLGLSSGLGQLGFSIKVAAISSISGIIAGAAGQITFSFSFQTISIVSLFGSGIIGSAVPIISALYGEKDYVGIRKITRFAILVLMAFLLISVMLFELHPYFFARIYNIDSSHLDFAIHGFRIFSLMNLLRFPVILMMYIYSAIRRNKLAIIISIVDSLLVIPTSLIMGTYMGADGIWWAFSVSALLLLLSTAIYTIYENIKNEHATTGLLMLPVIDDRSTLYVSITNDSNESSELSEKISDFLYEREINRRTAMRCGLLAEELVVYLLSESTDMNMIDIIVRIVDGQIEMCFRSDGQPISGFLAFKEKEDSISEKLLSSLSSDCKYQRYLGLNNSYIRVDIPK